MKKKAILIVLIFLFSLLSVTTGYRATNNIEVKDISFKSSSRTLFGIYTYPDDLGSNEKIPGIVVFHGLSASKEMMRPFTEGLATLGFAVLTIDQQGHGFSTGELGEDGNESLRIDGIAAVDYLKNQPQVDNSRIGLVGHSMGGSTVLSTSIALGDDILANVILGNSLADIETTKANTTNPQNLLLGMGKYDELFTVSRTKETMNYLTGSDSIVEDKVYGNTDQGNARRMVISPTEHIFEVLNPKLVDATMDWFEAILLDEGTIDSDSSANPWSFVLDQLLSTLAALSLLGVVPVIFMIRKANTPWEEGKVDWIIHGLLSSVAFILGGLLIFTGFGAIPFIFTSWMVLSSIFYLFKLQREREEKIQLLLNNIFEFKKSEIITSVSSIFSIFIFIQIILQFITWDYRYVLPILPGINLRRVPLFLLLFITGTIFYSIEIPAIGEIQENHWKQIGYEFLARSWPYLVILIIQYLPLFLFGIAVAPLAFGFLSFFLVGLVPIMLIVTVFSVFGRFNNYSSLAIAIINGFLIAWILSSTVPFIAEFQ